MHIQYKSKGLMSYTFILFTKKHLQLNWLFLVFLYMMYKFISRFRSETKIYNGFVEKKERIVRKKAKNTDKKLTQGIEMLQLFVAKSK